MSGNVWEWCEDWYHSSYEKAPTDGSPWLSPTGSLRVLRGGSWNRYPFHCIVANRYGSSPVSRDLSIGFRLARSL